MVYNQKTTHLLKDLMKSFFLICITCIHLTSFSAQDNAQDQIAPLKEAYHSIARKILNLKNPTAYDIFRIQKHINTLQGSIEQYKKQPNAEYQLDAEYYSLKQIGKTFQELSCAFNTHNSLDEQTAGKKIFDSIFGQRPQ